MSKHRRPVSVPGIFQPPAVTIKQLCEKQWSTRPCTSPGSVARWQLIDRRSGPGTFVLKFKPRSETW